MRNGLPERYAWLAAFGLVVTLVWLYIEMAARRNPPRACSPRALWGAT